MNTKAVFDADSDWFFLRMAAIRLDSECSVEFQFEDFDTSNNNHHGAMEMIGGNGNDDDGGGPAAAAVANHGYRQGVVWDFIELKQIFKVFEL